MAVIWNGQNVERVIRQAAMIAVVRSTENVRNTAIEKIMNPPKTGRIYRRRGVEHQASAPGESPANDTGHLVSTITTRYSVPDLTGWVNASAKYAPFLEFGTRKMAPRPYMRISLAEHAERIRADIANETRMALEVWFQQGAASDTPLTVEP